MMSFRCSGPKNPRQIGKAICNYRARKKKAYKGKIAQWWGEMMETWRPGGVNLLSTSLPQTLCSTLFQNILSFPNTGALTDRKRIRSRCVILSSFCSLTTVISQNRKSYTLSAIFQFFFFVTDNGLWQVLLISQNPASASSDAPQWPLLCSVA